MRHATGLLALAATACWADLGPSVERVRVDRSNHEAYFPIASGEHDGADCNACHGAFDTFTLFSCIRACHEHDQPTCAADHTAVSSFVYDDTSCYDCHPDGEPLSRAGHAQYFPITGSPHGEVDCDECHRNDLGAFVCTDCHRHLCADMNEKHHEVSGYQCLSTACLSCHPTGRRD
jgi:hypothetical protein